MLTRRRGVQWAAEILERVEVRVNRRRRWIGAATAIAGHLLVFMVLVRSLPKPPSIAPPNVVTMTLVAFPPVVPAPPAAPSPSATRSKPSSGAAAAVAAKPASAPRKPTPRPTPDALPAAAARAPAPLVELSEAQLSGATMAGSGDGSGADGPGGGGNGRSCDMVRRLQTALRRDVQVQAALAEAHRGSATSSRAVLVWNGDWIRSGLEDGKGLAGVRQAIMVEVAFAPAACRAEPMHGLVLISLKDGPGAARLALGSDAWRWSDLLFAR